MDYDSLNLLSQYFFISSFVIIVSSFFFVLFFVAKYSNKFNKLIVNMFFILLSLSLFLLSFSFAILWYIDDVIFLYVISFVLIITALSVIVFLFVSHKYCPEFKDWYYILKNWNKYSWDWSNWNANWKWKLILSDESVLLWSFKNWKLNWLWKIFDSDWNKSEWEFVNWVLNWKWKITFSNWNIYEWNFINWKLNWEWKMSFTNWALWEWNFVDWKPSWKVRAVLENGDIRTWTLLDYRWNWYCKHIFKEWWSLSGTYIDDLPDWEFTVVTNNCSVYKATYDHWKKIWDLVLVHSGDDDKPIWAKFFETNKAKIDDLNLYIQSTCEKFSKDLNSLMKKYSSKNGESIIDSCKRDLKETELCLTNLSKDNIILVEILNKDIERLKNTISKLQSFKWNESDNDVGLIVISNYVNRYADLLKSIFKKHRIKLRDKAKFSYWEYYQHVLKNAKIFNRIIVSWDEIKAYVKSISDILISSNDPKIFDKVKSKISKLYQDYLDLFENYYLLTKEFKRYDINFWKHYSK